MKYLNLFAGLFLLFSVVACDDENKIINPDDTPIVDWAPVTVSITATDMYGNDLLDPLSNSCILEGTTLTFQKKTYEVSYDFINRFNGAKAYMPRMYGLQLDSVRSSDKLQYRLYFGEIDGAKDMNEDLVINWGNGTSDVINYHCWGHNERKLSCNHEWKVNGKKVDGSKIEFVK